MEHACRTNLSFSFFISLIRFPPRWTRWRAEATGWPPSWWFHFHPWWLWELQCSALPARRRVRWRPARLPPCQQTDRTGSWPSPWRPRPPAVRRWSGPNRSRLPPRWPRRSAPWPPLACCGPGQPPQPARPPPRPPDSGLRAAAGVCPGWSGSERRRDSGCRGTASLRCGCARARWAWRRRWNSCRRSSSRTVASRCGCARGPAGGAAGGSACRTWSTGCGGSTGKE